MIGDENHRKAEHQQREGCRRLQLYEQNKRAKHKNNRRAKRNHRRHGCGHGRAVSFRISVAEIASVASSSSIRSTV